MQKLLARLSLLSLFIALSACHSVKVYKEAVCFIKLPEGVMTGITDQGFISLPRTKLNAGETGRTAIKNAVLIDTSLHVNVGEVIYDDRKNLHLYYNCTPIYPLKRVHYEDLTPARESIYYDVSVINPHSMTNWRGEKVELPWVYPKDILVMKRHFKEKAAISRTKPKGAQ